MKEIVMIGANSTISTCVGGHCYDIDGPTLTAVCLTAYALILGGITMCSRAIGCRLHDFASECALERRRQNEMIERLVMLSHDCRGDYEDSSESSDSDAPEQPAVPGSQ